MEISNNQAATIVKLWKIKRPAGRGFFDLHPLVEDEFGVWLHGARGSKWRAPSHATGTLAFDVLVLLSPERCWVAWWVDDPGDRRLEIDVCQAPMREDDGWSYVDLELDLVRHSDGTTEIVDRDEFDTACLDGWISEKEAEMANEVTNAMDAVLRSGEEPLGEEGWRRLGKL